MTTENSEPTEKIPVLLEMVIFSSADPGPAAFGLDHLISQFARGDPLSLGDVSVPAYFRVMV